MSADNSYEKIANEQLESCLKDPNLYVECLVKFGSVRGLLTLIYTEYVSNGTLTPIEKLPDEIKRKIWAQAQKDAAGRLQKTDIIQLSKCLYLCDFLILKWELTQKSNG